MRNQYRVLAEEYKQVQEATIPANMIDVLAKHTDEWMNYVDIDMPYDITYTGFINFVIEDPGLNRNIKAAWGAMSSKDKKVVFNSVVHTLAKKYEVDDDYCMFDPAIKKAEKKAKKIQQTNTAKVGGEWDFGGLA